MLTAANKALFVTPDQRVLLFRRSDEPHVWGLPDIAEQRGDSVPWTDDTALVKVDEFRPRGRESCDFQWVHRDFALSCAEKLTPGARVALRRFDGDILDQILARLDACASKSGDDVMSAEIANYSLRQDSHASFIEAQARADKVAQVFGDSAPRWNDGESLPRYRQRLLGKFKQHSADWKGVELAKLGDDALAVAETKIYADAMAALHDPHTVPAGTLREIIETDRTGRRISRFVGDPEACWSFFKAPVRYVLGINTKGNK
jgi:hypothetical protein